MTAAKSGTGPVLDVRGLTIALPTHSDRPEAVSEVSFSVERGEIVCLVGESGSGGSPSMRCWRATSRPSRA